MNSRYQPVTLAMQGMAVVARVSTDVELVAALRKRRSDAMATLFDRYGAHVHRVLLRTLGPDPDIGDLVHDVFVAAVEDIGRLNDPSKLRGWLSSIAVFSARACIRRRQRWRWLVLQPELTSPQHGTVSEVGEAVRDTNAVLDKLPVDERIAFSLRIVDGMKLEDVAEACRTSLATIKRRISRAEKRFLALAREYPALQQWLSQGTRWGDPNRA